MKKYFENKSEQNEKFLIKSFVSIQKFLNFELRKKSEIKNAL